MHCPRRTQLAVWLSRGRDRTQLDLQMRSATVIRFFKMMLRAWDEVRPFAYLLAEFNVSCVSFCSRWSACSELSWIMWQITCKLPASCTKSPPLPAGRSTRVSFWLVEPAVHPHSPRQAHATDWFWTILVNHCKRNILCKSACTA